MLPEKFDTRDTRYIESRLKYIKDVSTVLNEYSRIFSESGRIEANYYINDIALRCIHGENYEEQFLTDNMPTLPPNKQLT